MATEQRKIFPFFGHKKTFTKRNRIKAYTNTTTTTKIDTQFIVFFFIDFSFLLHQSNASD